MQTPCTNFEGGRMEEHAAVDYHRIFISMFEYDMGQILGTTNKPGEEFENVEPKQSSGLHRMKSREVVGPAVHMTGMCTGKLSK
jgi:hypothetical protein